MNQEKEQWYEVSLVVKVKNEKEARDKAIKLLKDKDFPVSIIIKSKGISDSDDVLKKRI